jgi:MraZ protein
VHKSGILWGIVSTVVFQGTSAIALDGKGRITIPMRQRDLLKLMSDGKLTITKSHGGFLIVFPRAIWESFREKLMALTFGNEQWRRLFLGSAVDVEADSGDRVLIPPELRAYANLTKDVLLIGNGNKLELWDKQRHAEHEAAVIAQGMPDEISGMNF